LWAIATYDLHLTLEEFEDLTPSGFRALRMRQKQEFTNARYLAAITAAAVYNVNRSSADSPIIDPIDFIREVDPLEANTNDIKKAIKQAIGSIPPGTTREKVMEIRSNTIASLTEQGRDDAEELFDSQWPSLAPKR
jgi:hypothetical protein